MADNLTDSSTASASKLRGTFLDLAPTQNAPVAPNAATLTPPPPPAAFDPAMAFVVPRRKFNFRIVVFVALACVLGLPIYYLVRNALSHGIIDHGSYKAVDLKAMGFFELPANGTIDNVPAVYRALDGQRVQLEGFMYPLNDISDHPEHFQFVYNIAKCCFGGPPLAQERVFCKIASGCAGNVPIDFSGSNYLVSFRILGVLHVNVHRDEKGNISSVYTMDVQKSEPM